VIATSVLLGTVFGSIEVAMIAFAQHHGAAGLSGGLVGLIAFGSLLGGLWYGARRWRRDLAVRYRVSMATLAIGALPAVAAGTLWQMAPSALLIGLSVAPTLIASSALVARVVPASARTEGFNWQNAGILVGVAAGAALAGLLIDTVGLRAAYVVSPVSAAFGAFVAYAGSSFIAPQPEPLRGLKPISG
jgi:MFS family permease